MKIQDFNKLNSPEKVNSLLIIALRHLNNEECHLLIKNLSERIKQLSICCNKELIDYKELGYDECVECGKTYRQT